MGALFSHYSAGVKNRHLFTTNIIEKRVQCRFIRNRSAVRYLSNNTNLNIKIPLDRMYCSINQLGL